MHVADMVKIRVTGHIDWTYEDDIGHSRPATDVVL